MAHVTGKDERLLRWLRIAGWGGATLLILTPLVLMQVAPESGFDWRLNDFLFAIALIGGTGFLMEAAVRLSSDWPYRLGAGVALITSFLLIWSNLAVGYIGSEDNPYNVAFFGVVAIAFAGALFSKLRARGMAVAMTVAAVAHGAAGAIGFQQDTRTGPITLIFVGLWLFSAMLFRRAARNSSG